MRHSFQRVPRYERLCIVDPAGPVAPEILASLRADEYLLVEGSRYTELPALPRRSFPGRGPARSEVRRYARHGTGVIRQQFQTALARLAALAGGGARAEGGSSRYTPSRR